MKKNILFFLTCIVSFLCLSINVMAEDLCTYEGKNSSGNIFKTIIATEIKNGYSQYQIRIQRNGLLLESSDYFDNSTLGLSTNKTDYNLKFKNVNAATQIWSSEDNVFFSTAASEYFLKGECPAISYHSVSSVCFQMANENDFCVNKNSNFIKQEKIYQNANRDDLENNTYNAEDAKALCTYKGKNSGGDNIELTIYYNITNNIPTYSFMSKVNDKLKIDAGEGWTLDHLEGGVNYYHLFRDEIFTKHEIYFSSGAYNQFSVQKCPEQAFYEEELNDTFCFQEKNEGNFCLEKDDKYFALSKVESSNSSGSNSEIDFKIPGYLNPLSSNLEKIKCDTIFKNSDGTYNKTYYLLQNAFNIMRYAAILFVLGFSIMDFIKAVASGDKDILNKTITKCVKRIIIGIAIFFVPILINFLLALLSEYTSCKLI